MWGEATAGALTDILGRRLPNHWSISMTHERYVAADGELCEATGVPVDMQSEWDLFSKENRDAGVEADTLYEDYSSQRGRSSSAYPSVHRSPRSRGTVTQQPRVRESARAVRSLLADFTSVADMPQSVSDMSTLSRARR